MVPKAPVRAMKYATINLAIRWSQARCRVVLTVLVVKEHRLSDLNQHPITILGLIKLQVPCTVLKIDVTSAAFSHVMPPRRALYRKSRQSHGAMSSKLLIIQMAA